MSIKYNKLSGKHVRFIGNSTGFGFGVAEAVLAAGANVTISASSSSKLSAAVTSLQATIQFPQSSQKIRSFTAADSISLVMLQDLTPDKILAACQMRLVAPLVAIKVATRCLPKSKESSFIITSSSAAHKSTPGWSAVSYFTAGLQGMVKQLAVELKPLWVNAVAPGHIDTGLWDHMTAEEKQAMVKGVEGTVPTGQFGRVEDVVEAYLWLLKDRNATGTVAATDSGSMVV